MKATSGRVDGGGVSGVAGVAAIVDDRNRAIVSPEAAAVGRTALNRLRGSIQGDPVQVIRRGTEDPLAYRELVAGLSGTTNTKARAYMTAQRQIQRWRARASEVRNITPIQVEAAQVKFEFHTGSPSPILAEVLKAFTAPQLPKRGLYRMTVYGGVEIFVDSNGGYVDDRLDRDQGHRSVGIDFSKPGDISDLLANPLEAWIVMFNREVGSEHLALHTVDWIEITYTGKG